MLLSFTLSMPNNNSWDRRWSGDGKPYVRVISFKGKKEEAEAAKILERSSYYYNFGDGWGASVAVKSVDAKEAAKLRRVSVGFCGYDWMIASIRKHGDIRVDRP